MTDKITRDELKALLDRGEAVTIIEALPEEYYRKGGLPGVLHLPHDQIDELAANLLPDKGTEIVVYCANLPCSNSVITAKRLSELGYTNVREYAEGKQDGIEVEHPIERGAVATA